MTQPNPAQDFLDGREFKQIVREVARDLERRLCSRTGAIDPLENDHFGSSPYDREHRITAIEGEIYAYVCKHLDRVLKLVPAGHDADDILFVERLRRWLERKFAWKLQDRARTADKNPYKYFRKRSGDVFRRHLHVETDRNGLIVFSLHPGNEALGSIPEEDLLQFPSPFEKLEGFEPSNATRLETLLAMGRLFWGAASKRKGGACVWVNLTDFVRWADQHLHLKPIRAVAMDELAERPADQVSPISWRLDREKIQVWAECFLGQMEDAERGLFHYLVCLKLKLEETAARLGYQSASGIDYPKKKLVHKLRSYLRDKDWLSPEDHDEEAQDYFRNVLCAGLKTAFAEP